MGRKKKVETTEEEKIVPIEKVISPVKIETVTFYDIDINVKKELGLREVLSFVRTVVDTIIEYATGEFSYNRKDYIIGIATLAFFTDLELPSDIEKQYDLVTRTNIVSMVVSHINEKQYFHILDSVDEQLRFEEQKILTQSKIELQEYVEQMKTEINELVDRYESMLTFMEKSFSGIDPNTMSQLLPAISKMKSPDEKSLVDAYLSATREQPELKVVK